MRRGKYEKQREPIFNVAICMAIVLFWLVIITTYMSSGLFARYSTQDTGSDSARVITFGALDIAEVGSGQNAEGDFVFIPGVDMQKDITVSFGGSEADTFVFVSLDVRGWETENDIDFTYKLGDKLIANWSVNSANWTLLDSHPVMFADEIPEGEDAFGMNGMRYVYYMRLDSNETLISTTDNPDPRTHVLADGGKITVSSNVTRHDYKALAGAKVNLDATAYVVQANGFYNSDNMKTNAQEAWNSLGE